MALVSVVVLSAWTWVDVPGTRCMDGSSTGFGIDAPANAKKLLIYLEGGGACFDETTCQTVAHISGFSAREFSMLTAYAGSAGWFDRQDPDNPFRDHAFVFIPYCTGDVHAARGFRNIGLDLERIRTKLPATTHVVLTGSSAGGFGALYNFDRVQQTFGAVPVTLVDDSGPPLGDTFLKPCLQQHWRRLWKLDETLPADCAKCGEGLAALTWYLTAKYPKNRFLFLSTLQDATTRHFFGFGYSDDCRSPGLMPASDFSKALLDFAAEAKTRAPNASFYLPPGTEHTFAFSGSKAATRWLREHLPAH